jgi:hypothetical protein
MWVTIRIGGGRVINAKVGIIIMDHRMIVMGGTQDVDQESKYRKGCLKQAHVVVA